MSSILLAVTYVAQQETVAAVSVFIILLTETNGVSTDIIIISDGLSS